MQKFEPFGDRVLVLPDGAPVKKTGLAEPPSQKEKAITGVVVACGPIMADITGQHVQFPKFAGRDVMHMGTPHLLLRWEELDGRLVEVED